MAGGNPGDGHSCVKRNELRQTSTASYKFAFDYQESGSGGGFFIIHASTNIISTRRVDPLAFLLRLGFQRSRVECPYFHDRCVYRYVYELAGDSWDLNITDRAHGMFDHIVANVESMYSDACRIYDKLGQQVDLFPWARELDTGPKVLTPSGAPPAWVRDWEVEDHQQAREALDKSTKLAQHYSTIEYCLHGKDDPLRDSVAYILKDLGFEISLASKDAPVDIFATKGELSFAIEVTGTVSNVNKSDRKINQAFDYSNERPEGQKQLLIANTQCETAPHKRNVDESFTPDALRLLEVLKVTALTTVDLYRLWKQCKTDEVPVEQAFMAVFNHEGGRFKANAS